MMYIIAIIDWKINNNNDKAIGVFVLIQINAMYCIIKRRTLIVNI